MDPHSILDKSSGDAPMPTEPAQGDAPETASAAQAMPAGVHFPGEDGGHSLAEMAERDLTATLQLLAERAQYITGATGAAIALRDGEEMVCRASAGSSAPEVGAQLQINSGLSGESVRTRQTLRCDDALTDERVNRESCEALGIRSVVVMPLLRGDDVIGVFELFSDKANTFEARDVTALERMGAMLHTALEHSAAALGFAPDTGKATRPAAAIPRGHFEDDEPGFAVNAGLAASHVDEALERAAKHPPAVSPAVEPIGRFEALAAAKAASRGIAFHMRAPVVAIAAPAVVPVDETRAIDLPGEAVPEPSTPLAPSASENQSIPSHSQPAVEEEADILEIPAEVVGAGTQGSEAAEEILAERAEANLPAAQVATVIPKGEPAMAEPSVKAHPVSGEGTPTPVAGARGAVAALRKCEACGFPVSEGRQLCLDCEKKKVRETAAAAKVPVGGTPAASAPIAEVPQRTVPAEAAAEMPRFLGGDEEEESWLAAHKFMVVAMVLAVVVIVVLMLVR